MGAGVVTAATLTLAEFLLARIAEDEAAARNGFSHPDRWVRVAIPGTDLGIPNGLSCTAVLAECEAKRRLTERHSGRHVCEDSLVGMRWDDDSDEFVDDPCRDLRLLALPYADHEDYQQEWRP